MKNSLEINPDVSPIYIGAGFLKEEVEIMRIVPEESLAAAVFGSYSDNEGVGADENGRKNVTWWDEANQAFYNRVNLKNPGRKQASEFLPRSLRAIKDTGKLAIVSVVALESEDPLKVLPTQVEWAMEIGADWVEIDGSCANHGKPMLCHDVGQAGEIIGLARQRVGAEAKIGLKVSALPKSVILAFGNANLPFDFYETMNALGRQPSPINPVTNRPAIEVGNGLAAQSGPIICSLARENLRMWQSVGKPVLSIGGVASGAEVYYRHHILKALMVGGLQEFHRARDPRQVAQRWAQEYVQANPNF